MISALTPQGHRAAAEWFRDSLTMPLQLAPEHTRLAAALSWDQAALDGLLTTIKRSSPGTPTLDMDIAPVLHASLPLGRRLASDRHVWAWLGLVPLRDLLQHRWAGANVDRFLGRTTQHGLARLWWAAELTLTEGPDPYIDTRRFVKWQYPFDRLLGSQIARSPAVLMGTVDQVAGLNHQVVHETVRRLGLIGGTVCLDALDRGEVAELVAEIVQAVRFGAA